MYTAPIRLRTSFVLGILSVSICLSSCDLPVESKYDEFDWNKFTFKPIDWNKFTFKPIDWNKFTFKPIDWSKVTSSPHEYYDYDSKSMSDSAIIILVILSVIGLNVFLFFCMYLLCRGNSSNSYDDTDIIVHRPPGSLTNMSRNRREYTRIHMSYSNREGNGVSFVNLLAEMPSDAGRDPFTNSNVNIPGYSTSLPSNDKPPDYEAVVRSDLSEHSTNFPSVTPEVPPPDYEEGNLPKY